MHQTGLPVCAEGPSHTLARGADMGTAGQKSSLALRWQNLKNPIAFDLVMLLLGLCAKKII